MFKKVLLLFFVFTTIKNYSLIYEFYNNTKFDIDYKFINRECLNKRGTIKSKESKKIEWRNTCTDSCIDFVRFIWEVDGNSGCQEFNIYGIHGCLDLIGRKRIKINHSPRRNRLILNKSRKFFEPFDCD